MENPSRPPCPRPRQFSSEAGISTITESEIPLPEHKFFAVLARLSMETLETDYYRDMIAWHSTCFRYVDGVIALLPRRSCLRQTPLQLGSVLEMIQFGGRGSETTAPGPAWRRPALLSLTSDATHASADLSENRDKHERNGVINVWQSVRKWHETFPFHFWCGVIFYDCKIALLASTSHREILKISLLIH